MRSYYDTGSFLLGLGHSDGPRIYTLSDKCLAWPSAGPKVAFSNWNSVLQRLRPRPDPSSLPGF